MMDWLERTVGIKDQKRGIVVLTHHQYISAFLDEEEFQNPATQLQNCLGTDREIIWIWGHEHRFATYKAYQQSPKHVKAWGRCIGNGGMPDEHLDKRKVDSQKAISRGLELYDYRVADTFHFDLHDPIEIGYNGYAQLKINKDILEITYWAAYWNGDGKTNAYNEPILAESWSADNVSGKIHRISTKNFIPWFKG